MKLKVCGMREVENISDLIATQLVDYIGFIFFEKSPRDVIGRLNKKFILSLPESVKKTGVFVKMPILLLIKKNTRHPFL